MKKLPILNQPTSFEEKRLHLELRSVQAISQKPMKGLKSLPRMVGIVKKDRKWLKFKALKYILLEDKDHQIKKGVVKRPFFYLARYVRSFIIPIPFKQEGDLFFYGINNIEEFKAKAKGRKLMIGFSYCQKPHECPSGRFTDQCVRDLSNPICSQCDIGKLSMLMPPGSEVVLIPTVHDIGKYFFNRMPDPPLFLITACEMTLKMFADFGNMLGIEGIGIKLEGRICNTMKAFELSEKGIKPGLTLVTSPTFQRLLQLLSELK